MNGLTCIVLGCDRRRLPARNGITFATCGAHTRVDMGIRDTRPEWVRRMQTVGLPPKDMSIA
jgi:hypothetical protein